MGSWRSADAPSPAATLFSPPPPSPPLRAQWPTHKIECKTPEAYTSFCPPTSPREGVPTASRTHLPAGCELAAKAAPAELASLIRAFLAAGDGPRASGIKAHAAAAIRLADIACASIADARAIVSAEGLLRRVERNLAAPTGGNAGLELALASINLLFVSVRCNEAAVCARVVEERDLLRALLLLVARGPHSRGDGSRAVLELAAMIGECATMIICVLSNNPVSAAVCARIVDEALSDADLQALVAEAVSRENKDELVLAITVFLTACLGHAPLLHRLVGPVGFPLALSKLLAGKGYSGGSRTHAADCLRHLIEAAREHGPPLDTWAKPLVKPLRAAFGSRVRGATPGSSTLALGDVLILLSQDPHLVPAVASGIPDFVSCLSEGGRPAICSARIIVNLATHPGARAAALREGAVPALVSLLHGKDDAPGPDVKSAENEEAAVSAFSVLGSLSLFDDARAALLATDAPLRLYGTLWGAAMAGLASDGHALRSLVALANLVVGCVLPVAALIDMGALERMAQLTQGGDIELALHATRVLLALLAKAQAADVKQPLVDALRAALPAFGAADAHESDTAASITRLIMELLSPLEIPRKDLTSLPLRFPESGRVLCELLVADAHVVPRLCRVVQARLDLAFDKDLRELDQNDVRCEPFYAGRILHFLDCYAGPAVAARLASLAPESVLRPVRAAAARGWWERPMTQASGMSAEGGGGPS